MIYLDNAATSFNKPASVKNAVINAMNKLTANPGRSGHKLSIDAADMVFETREKIKEFFSCPHHNVVFTKNCTEALNLAILGTLKCGDHVIASAYEHNSVLRPLEYLKEKGVEITILNCDMCDIAQNIKKEIKPNTKMVITTGVSNVVGAVCDIKTVGEICNQNGIIYLVDGAQACGHIDINIEEMKIDMLAFAGHKGMLAITGVGGLIISNKIKLNPIMFGGTGTDSESLIQPSYVPEGFEAGTIPTIPIASLYAGIEYLSKNFSKIQKSEQNLTKKLLFELKKLKFIKIYSNNDACNVVAFNIKNQDSMMVANMLNEYNICVRAGLHCAPLIHKKLGTINSGAVRVSLDFMNTFQEIDYLIYALKQINQKLSS